MSMLMLKRKMEGERRKVNSRPEVYITVREFVLRDEGSISFSTQEFSLNGLRVNALVEIVGTQKQIAKELGQEAASRLLKKASSWVSKKKDKKSSSKSEKATLVGKKAIPDIEEDGPQDTGAEDEVVQTCLVELVLNVFKEASDEKVSVKISDLSVGENTFTSPATAKKALGNSRIRGMIEAGIAKVVRHSLTKKLKKAKAQGVISKVCCCFFKCTKASPGV
jgi:hypothetical protein